MRSVEAVLRNPERLAALEATGLLDTPPEEEFDRFTRLAARLVGAPITLVSLVDDRRQFFKSAVGMTQAEPRLSHSFCKHVVAEAAPLIVSDAREHPLLHANLAVTELGVVAYLGMPLVSGDGHALGSFCAVDMAPRQWREEDVAAMRELASLVMERIELRLAAKDLQADYLALRTAEMRRDELVHMLVHDLRNPLSSLIMGMDALVHSAELSPMHRKLGDTALSGGEKLLEMVNNILDVSKAEGGRMSLELADAAPASIAQTACDQLAELAHGRYVGLHLECAEALPMLRVDADKIRRVLVNLMANAIQHSGRDGRVTVTVSCDGDGVRFAVSDTGYGIAPEAFERIFQKYGHVGGKIKGVQSTGLGLPFARLAVEAHGGRIEVESEIGRGSTFIVTLPCTPKA